jgi:hypothetical protein
VLREAAFDDIDTAESWYEGKEPGLGSRFVDAVEYAGRRCCWCGVMMAPHDGAWAPNTLFVAPELVRGTLAEGLRIFKTLRTPFQRAAFLMFVVLEIHPFVDGNGRLARAMMNAELAAAGENRILIVTSYRTD